MEAWHGKSPPDQVASFSHSLFKAPGSTAKGFVHKGGVSETIP